MKALLLSIILTGCVFDSGPELEEDLTPTLYLEDFEETFGVELESRIFMAYDMEDHSGVCIGKRKHIYLRSEWWERAPDDQRRRMIFHEVGHCEYNLRHDDGGFMNTPIPHFWTREKTEEAEAMMMKVIGNE